ncbi:hypothetical protein F441_17024 [Phytophthora nicotianae CJ01A1]|uniref:Uncharacterized protein n=5 Tax=Phytophthora nicotianae TaxID=4792 RepID=V9ECF0_PHYNI|nr:hypothetical protein F443_17150 [Phytophthora nicotianae P1569]ETK77018.1 hypothetical protein L915_16691 [Phytophthora nicotianae]ETO65529.1 hypothetical protein F444_17192 [Phytophthora nicotianae P1976]ETP06632.1 hypothetical protein F441_17024 [Phytophthora nicotianae CJ01A1]ETP34716.1 hypothetical protein F442_17025 [Phytophthora nicotianae P10297]
MSRGLAQLSSLPVASSPVDPALFVRESEASDNAELTSSRNHQNADDQEIIKIENAQLKVTLEKLLFAKQQSDNETEARIAKLETDNQQLHTMWKDEVTKRLDLEKKLQTLDKARMKQLQKSRKLRKICLGQVAMLLDIRQKVCQPRAVEQEKKDRDEIVPCHYRTELALCSRPI